MKTKMVEAVQWTGTNQYEVLIFVGDTETLIKGPQYPTNEVAPTLITFAGHLLLLDTVDGIHTLSTGDYIKKEKGEYTGMDRETFEQLYFKYEENF